MRTSLKIALLCLPLMLAVIGCVRSPGGHGTPESRRKSALERKQRIDSLLEQLGNAFEIVWDNVEVNDDEYLRKMLSIDVDKDYLFVTTDDGLLFILDATRGRRRAAYMPGSSQPIKPPVVRGSFMNTDYIYLVHENNIHAIDHPDREGMLTAAWVAPHDGVIVTPLCDTNHYLFFGDRKQVVYAVLKTSSGGRNDIRRIDRLGDVMETAPVTVKRGDRPFFMDASGSLYRFDGRFFSVLKPLQEGLGPVEVQVLLDEESGTLLAALANYKLYAIDAIDGRTIKWTGELGSKPVGSMYIFDRAVYVLDEDGELQAFHLDRTDEVIPGEPLWGGGPVFNVKKIISKGQENALYVLRAGNRIAKLDTASGKVLWERDLPEVDYLPVNRFGSTIYLGVREGWLWAVKPR